jgi:hypothetical protein
MAKKKAPAKHKPKFHAATVHRDNLTKLGVPEDADAALLVPHDAVEKVKDIPPEYFWDDLLIWFRKWIKGDNA